MRFAALLVVGLLFGSLTVACSTSSTTPGGPVVRSHQPVRTTATRTVVHTFRAYWPDGAPAIASARTESGYCWDSSLAASGPTAFRCFTAARGAGGQILDPCFAPSTPHPRSVLCVEDPWSRATTLQLTRALPAPVTGDAVRPWAVALADGARCVASTGTVPTVAGVNLSYHCSDGTAAALTRTTTAPWTAVDAALGARALRRTAVTAAWQT